MRVLVLCHEYPPVGGGAGACAALLTEEFVRAGLQTHVLTMGYDNLPACEERQGVRIERLACGRRAREMAAVGEALRWAVRACGRALTLHRQQPFDVSHAHFIMPGGLAAWSLQRLTGLPFVITPHGSDVPGYNRERLRWAHRFARPLWKRVCADAGCIISPSHSLLELMRQTSPHFPAAVIPNGFRCDRFQPLEKQRRILMCGRFVERKGFHLVLQALAQGDWSGWQVDLVGDGPLRERLASLAERCPIPVHQHGWLQQDDPRLARLYGRAAIFALPSEQENFPVSLLEAMSAGCAVVTTDVSGNPEVVGATGVLVPANDVAAVRDKLLSLTQSLEHCVDLGREGRERVHEEFSADDVARQYLEVLADVAERGAIVGGGLRDPMRVTE